MWADFEDAGAFKSTTDIGDGRERALAAFLRQRLPERYGVARGEVIDHGGAQSGQTDILIYDASNTAPLLSEDGQVLLAAEALLASIEVKSKLTKLEAEKALGGIARIRALRPFGNDWGVTRELGKPADDGLANFFATVFAFDTDLALSSWSESEIGRVRSISALKSVPSQWVDRVVVLSRGIVLPAAGTVVTFDEDQRVLGLWFFHLMNFLARESARRRAFPWNEYESKEGATWLNVLPAVRDAPVPVKRGTNAKRNYRAKGPKTK
jgi:hypothetical protein